MKLPKNLIKPLCLLAFLILLCTFLSKLFSSSETLLDYSAKHPELAYQESMSSEEIESTTEELISTESTSEEADTTKPIDESEFTDEYEGSDKRFELEDGFFYEPIPQYIEEKITGISYPTNASVSLNELCYMNVQYYDFNGEIQKGELICNTLIANDLIEIFHDLYKAEYQIEKIKLIDDYQGDDHLSMLDNNTSCFNYRVVDDTTKLSKHAYGLAIDINPFYNPYVTYDNGVENVSPEGSEVYADRTQTFPYKIDENDLCYKLFMAHGFTWGGNWNSCKDYQHFQKTE